MPGFDAMHLEQLSEVLRGWLNRLEFYVQPGFQSVSEAITGYGWAQGVVPQQHVGEMPHGKALCPLKV